MRQLALDPVTNDLALVSGPGGLPNSTLALLGSPGVVSPDVLAQKLRVRLGLYLGEYVLDRGVGVPWMQQMLGKVPPTVAEGILRQAIQTCPGVAALLSFTLAVDTNREASVTFVVKSITGDVVTVTDFRPGGAP